MNTIQGLRAVAILKSFHQTSLSVSVRPPLKSSEGILILPLTFAGLHQRGQDCYPRGTICSSSGQHSGRAFIKAKSSSFMLIEIVLRGLRQSPAPSVGWEWKKPRKSQFFICGCGCGCNQHFNDTRENHTLTSTDPTTNDVITYPRRQKVRTTEVHIDCQSQSLVVRSLVT